MFLTTLLAESDDGGGGSGAIIQLGILLLIPVAMYFLMIRPQRRRMREQSQLQSSLDVGDEIITSSGIYGFITGFEGDRVWVEIDDDVQIRLAKGAIQGKVDTSAEPADAADDGSDTSKGSTDKGGDTADDGEGDDADDAPQDANANSSTRDE